MIKPAPGVVRWGGIMPGMRLLLAFVALLQGAAFVLVFVWPGPAPALVMVAGLALVAVAIWRARSEPSAADTAPAAEAAEQLAPLATWSYDLQRRAMHWSAGMYRLLGRTGPGAAASARACLRALHGEDRRRALEAVRQVLAGGPEADLCVRVVRGGGDERLVRVRLSVHAGGRGGARQLVGTCLDLTEELRQVSHLVDSLTEADGVRRSKEVLFASLSHEIRTPLTGILGFTEILIEEVNGAHRDFMESIQRNGYRLLDTLTSILDLARIEGSMMPAVIRQMALAPHIEHIVSAMRPQAEEKDLFLRVACSRPGIEAFGDPGHLQRVLAHLLSNAIKFTRAGGVVVEVDADAERAFVRVHDTGVGIGADFVPQVFDAFKQESAGLDRSHEGSGLGLTIAKELVELMGGTIGVQSEKGRGSTFTVVLPRVRTTSPPAVPGATEVRARSSSTMVSCPPEPGLPSHLDRTTVAAERQRGEGDGAVHPVEVVGL